MAPYRYDLSQRDSSGEEDVQLLGDLCLSESDSSVTENDDVSQSFDGKSAWFSLSVDTHTKQLWIASWFALLFLTKDHPVLPLLLHNLLGCSGDYGGIETEFDHAEFIFSADNSSPDTLRVFNSTPYIMEHLEVFHSQFISDAVREWDQNGSQVVLGRYILPPQDILNDVRKHITLSWDVADQENQQPSSPNSRQERAGASQPGPQNTHSPSEEGVVHIRQLRKVRADAVTDFVPMEAGAEVYHKVDR